MRRSAVVLSVALLVGLAAPADASSRAEARRAEQESRIRFMADEFDEELRRSGAIVDEPVLAEYLGSIMTRLFGDEAADMRVMVHHSPDANAFALPNGSIYVTIGMLARVDSESQAAVILGHEGEHYLRRHGVSSMLAAKGNSVVGMVVGVATGIPLAGALLAGSSYAGFSQNLEREADEHGFNRVRDAGYAVDEAHVFFERMAREARALRRRDGSMFASHPKLTERAATLRRLAGSTTDGDRGRERFLAVTSPIRVAALAEQVAQRQIKATILLLEEEGVLEYFPPEARYFLAEAYRLRNDDGDPDLAVRHLEVTAREAPAFAPTWRSLGLHYMRTDANAEALAALGRYLELLPDAPDRAFIESYMERMRATAPAQGGDA